MKQAKKTVVRAAWIYTTRHGNKKIQITFPYNKEDVQRVRQLPNRKFHDDNGKKYWTCDLSIEAVEWLDMWGFKLSGDLRDFINNAYIDPDDIDDQLDEEKIGDNDIIEKLYPFQRTGVNFIEETGGRALITDEMGLGKTVQALTWIRMHPEKRPVLIVVPASLKLNWKREAEKWLDNPDIQILSGKTPYEITSDIVIINYDIIKDWTETLKEFGPQVFIGDEIHYIKNNKAQRTRAVKEIARKMPHVIGLTGTPVINRPIEVYNAINLIDRSIFPSWWRYVKKYCGAKQTRYGLDVSGATNTNELHRKLVKTVMLRRKKEDVLSELPDKVRTFLPVEIDNPDEYKRAENNFITFIRETKGKKAARKASNAEALAKISTLKQVAVKGKLKNATEWIKDILDTGEKLVVFGHHKFVIDELMKKFSGVAVKIDGSVSQKNRQQAVDKFQNDDSVRLFVGNMKAAGVGITLTAASKVAFLELGHSPSDHDQASDRVHRIGQKNSVNVYYLLANDTIEEKIARMIDEKRKVVDRVTDGQETDESSLLTQLMNEYYEQLEEEEL
jgi:SWI/SNF-related matrix-associated actin-dependent regulator 1 of chromatin subfamily A